MSYSAPSATVTSAFPSDPTTPAYPSDVEWITAYLTIHSLSVPSRRYSFLLWIIVVFIFLVFAILHWTGSRGGYIGACWTKWSLRRRTWRKKHKLAIASRKNEPHRQPRSFPSNAQLLSLGALLLGSLALAFVGPDYISPSLKVWQIRRDESYNVSAFASLQPQYTIAKAWWTSSARTGQIAFALFPLCVLFALKAPPFAIFAIPFMIQLFFDKMAWLHRWSGRLIWFLTAIHVALWSVQLAQDRRAGTGKAAYIYAWSYEPFICGWIAFGLLTLLILSSIHPIRRKFYEAFYFMHVMLVPFTLVAAALHHPPIWWWCWAALAVWGSERLWRGTWWIHTNGFVGGMSSEKSDTDPSQFHANPNDVWEMNSFPRMESQHHSRQISPDDQPARSASPLASHYHHDKIPFSPADSSVASPTLLPSSVIHTRYEHTHSPSPMQPAFTPPSYTPPPGYAHAELLPGRTIRLRLITPGYLPWAPGQHFLVNIPYVSRFTSHPFTCASVCDEQAPSDEGRMIVMLLRAKGGWTQDLWNAVTRLQESPQKTSIKRSNLPKRGVLLRTYIDGPFGSSVRARWGNYSTILIIAGGSGVSFGLSILQYMCLCLSGRDGKHLGGRPGGWGKKSFVTKRVRFVWLIREYSHLHWCASIIHKCLTMVPASMLQVDIYVTNFKPIAKTLAVPPPRQNISFDPDQPAPLTPPHPSFARDGHAHSRNNSAESVDSYDSSVESDVDLSYYTGEYDDEQPSTEDIGQRHDNHLLELTNFDGDDDTAMPGEEYVRRKVKKEGKLRRALSRRVDKAATAKKELDIKSVHLDVRPRARPISGMSLLSAHSTDRLLPLSPLSDHLHPATYSPETISPMSASTNGDIPWRRPRSGHFPPLANETSVTPMMLPSMLRGAVSASQQSSSTWEGKTEVGISRGISLPEIELSRNLAKLDLDDKETADVNAIAELARAGKPRLDRILADEVERSKGSVVVACCGPTSLNAVVRKIIAAQIDPSRLRRGDMRGSIALVSEEFEY
ncbi:hypothetical protein BJ138DRAFT_999553 [Hygrophoropsis aurantiaca]|uniref:Uncharacterized protein n=1 Tax=Hygrophoropsis aurantiaca TaxID=72124 RepID=A0ACB8AQ45_9AGAM|nr:hypothetical protein BJ138DRAFT_999553 [Hygrophoropsis aurantiaca]